MRTLADAIAHLETLDVVIEIEHYHDETIPRDTVLTHEPAAGTALREGSVVVLRVSTGPENEQVIVPNLIGQEESAAIEMLRDAYLIAGIRTNVESTTYAAGLIINQTPMPHDVVDRNTVVSFTVSTGAPAPTATPAPTPTPAPPADSTGSETPGATTPPINTPDGGIGTTPPPSGQDTPPSPPPVDGTDAPPADTPPPAQQSGTLTIALWPVPEGTTHVHLVILRQDGNDEPRPVVNDPSVSIDRFPVTYDFEGSGSIAFHVFSIDNGAQTPRSITHFNLDE